MKQTTAYKLPQWEKADRIVMEDFNGMASKLETALTAHDTAIAGLNSAKADKTTTNSLQTQVNQRATTSALSSAVSQLETKIEARSQVVIGSYTGDGAAERVISLGFTPKAVLLIPASGELNGSGSGRGGLALPGHAVSYAGDVVLTIVTGGFKVYYKSGSWGTYSNANNSELYYIAFR